MTASQTNNFSTIFLWINEFFNRNLLVLTKDSIAIISSPFMAAEFHHTRRLRAPVKYSIKKLEKNNSFDTRSRMLNIDRILLSDDIYFNNK